MNIEERKNNKLIFRLIELSDLINGRDNLQNESNKLIEDIMRIESSIIYQINDFNQTVNSIRNIENIDNFLYIGHKDCGYEGYYKKNIIKNNLNDSYSKVLYENFKEVLCYVENKYRETIKSIPEINISKEISNNYFNLARIIFKRENSKLVETYKNLHKEVLKDLENYKFTSNSVIELGENDIGISNNMIRVIEKENSVLFFNNLKERNERTIADIRNKIDKVTRDIGNEFINLIPKKYIFNENFRNYAIECLFYGRCNTIGEVINLYENFELHTEANITLRETLNSLNDFQAMNFHQLMQIKNSIYDIGEDISYSLKDGFDNMSNDIKDLSDNITETNYSINSQIESSNLLAQKQLDNLSEISKGTREIGKNIYEVKDFTDKYRVSQLMDGKYI